MTTSGFVPRRVFRTIAAALAAILLWVGPDTVPSRICLAGPGDGAGAAETRMPVALILDPDGSEEALGPDARVPPGFLLRLQKDGYSPGGDLFALSPGSYADLSSGSWRVADFVKDCAAKTPGGRVDVVACGTSGLVARLAIEGGMVPDGVIRNLIMVGAPNRGTFLAGLVKSIVEITRHELALEKETRAWRYLPFGDELVPWRRERSDDDRSSGSGAGAEASDLTGLADMAWEDEAAWISERVRRVYEPLYARYVAERYMALPYLPSESPKETFAGWIRRTMPAFWESAVRGGVLPPGVSCGSQSAGAGAAGCADPAGGVGPAAGRDLTAAYYEVLSMEVARNQYVMRLAARGTLIESLVARPYAPEGWKDALVYYGVRALQHYARKALVTLKAEIQSAAVDAIVRRTGFARDPASPMLRRLVKEDLLVNLGTSMSKRFERLPANGYLASLNGSSQRGSEERKTRCVSLAARLTNPWSVVWPQLGPNDLFLEVDCSVAPVGPGDSLRVFPGLFSPAHDGLLADPKVQDHIMALTRSADLILDCTSGRLARDNAPRLTVSSWRPAYVELGTDRCGSAALLEWVSIVLPDPPAGWQYSVWTRPSDPGAPGGLKAVEFASGGRFTYVPAVPGSTLGMRLARTGSLNPVLAGTVSSAYASEIRVEARISAGTGSPPVPGAAGTAQGIFPPEAGGEIRSADAPAPPAAQPPQSPPEFPAPGESLDASCDPVYAGGIDLTYPLVRVVNRSKRTTHKEPKETYHEYWMLDFGDGTTRKVDGNPVLSVSHAFQKPGSYRVRAESYDAKGEQLVSRDQLVVVSGGADAVRQFSYTSIARLDVELALTGPLMWVTGRPAIYSADIRIEPPAHVKVLAVDYDPGPKFAVLWERAGGFQVSCAATVRLRYLLEDEEFTVENVYLREARVEVLTTGVTR